MSPTVSTHEKFRLLRVSTNGAELGAAAPAAILGTFWYLRILSAIVASVGRLEGYSINGHSLRGKRGGGERKRERERERRRERAKERKREREKERERERERVCVCL